MSHKKIGIYLIISPSGKIYVGQSWDIIHRWSTYKWGNGTACKHQTHLYNSLQKYGYNAHNFSILIEVDDKIDQDVLNFLEDTALKYVKANGYKVMNIREAGGKGKLSEETKRKISASNKGKHSTTGRKHTEETKQKIRLIKLGTKFKPESIEKSRVAKYKRLINTVTGEEYISVTDAAKKLGLKKTTLIARLKGQNRNFTNLVYA